MAETKTIVCLANSRKLSPEARRLLTDAVAAIDEALKLEPKSPDALWEKSTILICKPSARRIHTARERFAPRRSD